MIEELGKRIKASYTHFAADFAENPTTYFTRVLLVLFFSGMLTIMMFVFPDKIREEQIDSLVYADITSTKLQPLVLSDASKTIAENKAISVMSVYQRVSNMKRYWQFLMIQKKWKN